MLVFIVRVYLTKVVHEVFNESFIKNLTLFD